MSGNRKSRSNTANEKIHPIHGGVDYISKLPEHVIGHILSRLPIKAAVKTSVLSKDWEDKWTNVYDISIDEKGYKWRGKKQVFEDFMDRISSRLSLNVKSYSLVIFRREWDFYWLRHWILPVLGPKLEMFNLEFNLQYHHERFILPQPLLNCTSLTYLHLHVRCTFKVPDVVRFPYLTCLKLREVEILNDNNGVSIVLQFPALKIFESIESKWLNVKSVELHTPNLDQFAYVPLDFSPLNECSFKIVGASLSKFAVDANLLDRFILDGSTVALTTLECYPDLYDLNLQRCKTLKQIGWEAKRLFDEVSTMECLYLHCNSTLMKAFSGTNFGFPRYDKLEKIKLFCVCTDLNFLLELLHATLFLKYLEIGFVRFRDDFDDNSVENVPFCIASSLEEVKFRLCSYTTEFRKERFILKFGARIKTAIFCVQDAKQKDEIHSQLSTFSVASDSLDIRFVFQHKARVGGILFSNRKLRKNNPHDEDIYDKLIYGDRDYLSKLPDYVLSHILSRLPTTKDAMRTCVLSKGWKYKWTSIYNIDVTDVIDPEDKHAKKTARRGGKPYLFVDMMERMLLLSFSHHVRSFTLLCRERYDFNRMAEWVLPILGPNLESFALYPRYEGLTIPQGLLNCTSLKRLNLSQSSIRVPALHTFPNLTYLSLKGVEILSENSNRDTMILKFPVLKTLLLTKSKWMNVTYVEIHAPALDSFVSETDFDESVHDYSIKIIGATLTDFKVSRMIQDTFIFSRSTVARASLTIFNHPRRTGRNKTSEEIILKVQMLFNELSSIKTFSLKCYVDVCEGFLQSNLRFPVYDKLERIQLDIVGGASLNFLLRLLQAAPSLKFLEIHLGYWDGFNYDMAENNVPLCLLASLEEVKFSYANCIPEPQFCLESFILKFGAQLKRVFFSVYVDSRQKEIYDRLSALPKASPDLSIQFALKV